MDHQLVCQLVAQPERTSSITQEFELYRSQLFNDRKGEGIQFTITCEVLADRINYYLNPNYSGIAARATLRANGYDITEESFQRLLVYRLNTKTGKETWFNQSHPLFTTCYISRATKQPVRPLLFYTVVKQAVVKFSAYQAKLTTDTPLLPDIENQVLGIEIKSIHNRQPSSHRRFQQRQADLYRARKQQKFQSRVSIR